MNNCTAAASGVNSSQLGRINVAAPPAKPALMPNGLYFTSQGTVASYYDTNFSFPVLATCTGWMVDAGLYVAQADFWMPNQL